jgi:hypothetical protein
MIRVEFMMEREGLVEAFEHEFVVLSDAVPA